MIGKMVRQKVVIDCDPGSDDAIALILALASEELDVQALLSVSGNGSIENTTRNAANILNLCNRADVPVYRGSANALDSDLAPETVEAFGDDGLGGCAELIYSDKAVEQQDAVDSLIDIVNRNPGEITLFALGPCTNIALAMRKSEHFCENLKRIIIMGGAKNTGNCSPVAEYNFWADPVAAREVLKSGIKDKIVVGLDVTNSIAMRCDERERFRLANTKVSNFIYEITRLPLDDNWKTRRMMVSPMHDVLTVAYFIKPELLTLVDAYIDVSTEGITKGQSVVDVSGHWHNGTVNAKFATQVDRDGFFSFLFERLGV